MLNTSGISTRLREYSEVNLSPQLFASAYPPLFCCCGFVSSVGLTIELELFNATSQHPRPLDLKRCTHFLPVHSRERPICLYFPIPVASFSAGHYASAGWIVVVDCRSAIILVTTIWTTSTIHRLKQSTIVCHLLYPPLPVDTTSQTLKQGLEAPTHSA